MTPAQEAAFDRKAEAWCRGHRPCPSGRDPRFWNRRDRPGAMDAYRNGYDRIRWGTPDTNDTGPHGQFPGPESFGRIRRHGCTKPLARSGVKRRGTWKKE